MAEEKREPAEQRRHGGWKLLAIAALLAVATGGGVFHGVRSGALPLPFLERWFAEAAGSGLEGAPETVSAATAAYSPGAYVRLDPLVVSLGREARADHLKVSLVIEVAPGRESEVEAAKPRLLDVLNVFLRAVDEREFEVPQSMERLRAQMLRRVQLVAPQGAVHDVLIQEFVLN